jgi:tetratricopeptide (TPR) repeat protein
MKEFLKSTRGVLVIACTSFIVIVAFLSAAIYFLSAGQKPIKDEANAPVVAFWEVMKYAFDPEKIRHISRGEGAFFRAEAANHKHQYQLAHDNYEEASHEILLGAGDQSLVAATFLERQAMFENDSGKYAVAVPICRKVLTMMPYCNDRIMLLRTRQQLARALVFGTKVERAEAVDVCQGSLATAQAADKDRGVSGYDSETSSVLEWLAYCQRQDGRIDDAIATYKKTIAQYEQHGKNAKDKVARRKITSLYVKLVSAELQRNNVDAAIGYCDAALASGPEAVRMLRLRSSARVKKHDYDGAVADILAADKLKPNDVVTTDELMAIYYAKGDAQAALTAVNSVIGKKGGEDAYFYALRGFVYADQKQVDKAVSDLHKAIALSPKESIYHRYLADIYLGCGQYKQAIAELNGSMDLKASTLQSRYLRSIAYGGLHDYKAAIDDLSFMLGTMHRHGFTLEEVKGFQVKYKFVDKAALLRTRGGYYDLDHQPAKALADKAAADAAAKGKGENYQYNDVDDDDEYED